MKQPESCQPTNGNRVPLVTIGGWIVKLVIVAIPILASIVGVAYSRTSENRERIIALETASVIKAESLVEIAERLDKIEQKFDNRFDSLQRFLMDKK